MFPITCSSVGDIIAISAIICNIARALNESRGSPAEYRDFTHEIDSLKSTFVAVARVVQGSANVKLQHAVMKEISECWQLIREAMEKLNKFAPLGKPASASSSCRARLARSGRKLQWYFVLREEIHGYRTSFQACRARLDIFLATLSVDKVDTNFKAAGLEFGRLRRDFRDFKITFSRTAKYASSLYSDLHKLRTKVASISHETHQLSDTISYLATLPSSLSTIHQDVIGMPSRTNSLLAAYFAAHAADVARRETIASATLANAIGNNTALVGRSFAHLAREQDIIRREENATRQAVYTAVAVRRDVVDEYAAAICITLAICTTLDVFHRNLRMAVLYVALTIAIRTIWKQQNSLTSGVSSESTTFILIDFLDRRLPFDLSSVQSFDRFRNALAGFFAEEPGSAFVRAGAYEINDASNAASILRRESWQIMAVPGMVLEMSVVMLQDRSAARTVECPWCHAQSILYKSSEGEEYSCMGCGRGFRKANVEELSETGSPSRAGDQASTPGSTGPGFEFSKSALNVPSADWSRSDSHESDIQFLKRIRLHFLQQHRSTPIVPEDDPLLLAPTLANMPPEDKEALLRTPPPFPPPFSPLGEREFTEFWQQWAACTGTPFNPEMLNMDGKQIKLADLHRVVFSMGGCEKVSAEDKWAFVGGRLGWGAFTGSGGQQTANLAAAQRLRHVYESVVAEFDNVYRRQARAQALLSTLSPPVLQQLISNAGTPGADMQKMNMPEQFVRLVEANREVLFRMAHSQRQLKEGIHPQQGQQMQPQQHSQQQRRPMGTPMPKTASNLATAAASSQTPETPTEAKASC